MTSTLKAVIYAVMLMVSSIVFSLLIMKFLMTVGKVFYPTIFAIEDVNLNDDYLNVVIDVETGCNYISLPNGITPRLDKDGKQICD